MLKIHPENFPFTNMFITEKDPIVETWPFMGSPVTVPLIIFAYLLMVRYGPKYMANKKPFHLKSIIMTYNLFQVIFNAWICFVGVGFRLDYAFQLVTNGCTTKMSSQFLTDISKGAWWYLMAKLLDLTDTLFFILRKKENQITGLHVYHHSTTVLITWGYLKYVPSEQGIVIGFLNSFIHVIMYFYYFLSGLGPSFQKYLWWKKYMTMMQLIQFCLLLTYFTILTVMDCKPAKGTSLVLGTDIFLLLILFLKFYFKSYSKRTSHEVLKKE